MGPVEFVALADVELVDFLIEDAEALWVAEAAGESDGMRDLVGCAVDGLRGAIDVVS